LIDEDVKVISFVILNKLSYWLSFFLLLGSITDIRYDMLLSYPGIPIGPPIGIPPIAAGFILFSSLFNNSMENKLLYTTYIAQCFSKELIKF